MKKTLIALLTFGLVFLYRIYVDYSLTISEYPSSTNVPLNIAGALGESLVYFIIIYPLVLLIQLGIARNKEPIKKSEYDEMIDYCKAVIKMYSSQDKWIFKTIDNEKNFSNWIDYISEDIKEITNNTNNNILKLREKTIKMLEVSSLYEPLINDKLNDEEKKAIASFLTQKTSFEETLVFSLQAYTYAEAATACYRLKSLELGDAQKNDWFDLYNYVHKQLISAVHKDQILKFNHEENTLEFLIPLLQQVHDEVKQGILNGENFNYDEIIEKMENNKKEFNLETNESQAINNFNSNPNLIDYSKSANNVEPLDTIKELLQDIESLGGDDFIDALDDEASRRNQELIETYTIDGWEFIHTDEGQKMIDLYAEKLYEVLEANLGHAIHTTDLKELSYAVFNLYYFPYNLENSLNKNMIATTEKQRFNVLKAARDFHIELIKVVKNKILEN